MQHKVEDSSSYKAQNVINNQFKVKCYWKWVTCGAGVETNLSGFRGISERLDAIPERLKASKLERFVILSKMLFMLRLLLVRFVKLSIFSY